MSVRDITLEDTIYIAFTTRAFATGIPTTLAGSPVVSAYEDAGLTQITAGITLGVDHDGVTGLNMLTIVATAANGYSAGKDYALVITAGTVDSVSVVGEVVGEFTIGRSAAAVDLAQATDGLGAIKGDTAAILIDTTGLNGDAMRGTDSAALASVATEARLSELDAGTSGKAANQIDLIKTEADKIALADAGAGVSGSVIEEVENRATPAQVATELATYDGPTKAEMDTAHALLATPAQVNTEVDNALDTAIPGAPTANSINERIKAIDDLTQASGGGDLAAILADVTGINGDVMRGTDNAALASVLGALADAAADGDPTATDTLMQYVKQLINVLIGTAGIVAFPAEAAPANAVSLAEVIRAIHADVTGLAGTTVAAIVDAVWDEALSGHATSGTAGEKLDDVPLARFKKGS